MNKAMFGAGCFWGIEKYFQNIQGITSTKVGYSGGNLINPTYEEVCLGTTNHAEVVLIEFDDELISYKELLDHFWKCHDPTQLNRQGPDIGTQYRSIIFYYSEKQKKIADESKKNIQNNFNEKVITEIKKVKDFFIAEEYHQCFIKKQSDFI